MAGDTADTSQPSNKLNLPIGSWNAVATLILFAVFMWDRSNGSRDASNDIKNLVVQIEKRVTALEADKIEKYKADAKFQADIMTYISEAKVWQATYGQQMQYMTDYYRKAQRQ